ncbi:MAG: hypothetical protein U0802_00675 [Candidatus Binatia bacterium]
MVDFQAVRQAAPGVLRGPLLKPVAYLEHSFSPATFRRGCCCAGCSASAIRFRSCGLYERIESPWGMGVVLHEIGHNLQADLGIWEETRVAVQRRVLQVSRHPWLARIWARWHKERSSPTPHRPAARRPGVGSGDEGLLAYPASRV